MKNNEYTISKSSRDRQSSKRPYQERGQDRGRGHHLPQRSEPGFHKSPRYREEKQQELKPMPIGNMCNAVCPLFRCTKRVLTIKLINGKPNAFCTWVNDTCISYKCQYASCFQRYLLPDGKCTAASRSSISKEDMFIKELEKSDDDKSLKTLLSRKGFGKDLLY